MPANGYLRRRLVDIGDRVRTGQLLAEIEISSGLTGTEALITDLTDDIADGTPVQVVAAQQ